MTKRITPPGPTEHFLIIAALCLWIAGGLHAAPREAKPSQRVKATDVTAATDLKLLPGFKAELLHAAGTNEGSWICMTIDSRGRFIISPQKDDQPLLRVTLGRAGQVEKIETLAAPVHEAMGLCFAHDSLYVNGKGPDGPGLYRLVDANHNDQFEANEVKLLKKFDGRGEHGYHAVVAGPDGMIYVMNGNHTRLPEGVSATSPHKNFQEDHLLPRMWDGNGHAVGILAPGGYVVRTDAEGRYWELLLAGFRNSYDFDFNAAGEMFTFDSDMEWDWGMPWYRPTRINHCVIGGEYGWRSGAGVWPEYYADSLPAAVNIGLGSPTGVKFGTKSKFPKKYQDALFAMDWSYGRILAVHLQPQGASYTGDFEEFVKGKPLNVTDLEFGKDGAMYFITGGRGTKSGLYRISYDGKKSGGVASTRKAGPAPSRAELKQAAKARELRHRLESFHGKKDPQAVAVAWPHLASEDRFIRYAARIAIEWQDVALWQQRALNETNTGAGLTVLLALARCGGRETQNDLLLALKKFPFASLTEEQQLEKLRILQLSFIRQGRPTSDMVRLAVEKLNPLYPAASDNLNRELVQLLIYLDAPGVVSKTLALLDQATTMEQQAHYIYYLRNVKSGWTLEQRKKYFTWFVQAKKGDKPEVSYPNGGAYMVWTNQALASRVHSPELVQWFSDVGRNYGDGSSYAKFLANIRRDAAATLTADERTALTPLLEENVDSTPWKPVKEREFVRTWTAKELEPLLDKVGRGRNFESGRAAFNDTQCIVCHRFGNEGGSVGPELTAASSKYSRRDILEAILDPSKEISDQFQTFDIIKKNGEDVSGRVMDDNGHRLLVQRPSLTTPEVTVEVLINDIARREVSKVSSMPTGLISSLTQDEVLDLLAYIEAMGFAKAGNFGK